MPFPTPTSDSLTTHSPRCHLPFSTLHYEVITSACGYCFLTAKIFNTMPLAKSLGVLARDLGITPFSCPPPPWFQDPGLHRTRAPRWASRPSSSLPFNPTKRTLKAQRRLPSLLRGTQGPVPAASSARMRHRPQGPEQLSPAPQFRVPPPPPMASRPQERAGLGRRAVLIGQGCPDAETHIRARQAPSAPDVLSRESPRFPASTVLGRNPALDPPPRPAAQSQQPFATSSPRPRPPQGLRRRSSAAPLLSRPP